MVVLHITRRTMRRAYLAGLVDDRQVAREIPDSISNHSEQALSAEAGRCGRTTTAGVWGGVRSWTDPPTPRLVQILERCRQCRYLIVDVTRDCIRAQAGKLDNAMQRVDTSCARGYAV